jgi:hypothetical protein
MIMKDPIVEEIHRHRAEWAKRFNYDVRAIGEDVRRHETKSQSKFAARVPHAGPQSGGSARRVSTGH